MSSSTLALNGQPLTLEELAAVAYERTPVVLHSEARQRMEASRAVVDRYLVDGTTVYGINTGFGKMSEVSIPPDQLADLQLNLVRSHACGVGESLSEAEIRGMLLLRANVLAKGTSGVRVLVAEHLLSMLEKNICPVVPARGSVGASGDLAPLAHLALGMIGEGEVLYQGKRIDASDALAAAGMEPLRLAPKEGLALLNGTQAMAAVGGLALLRAERVARLADLAGAMTLEASEGNTDCVRRANSSRAPTSWPDGGCPTSAFVAGTRARFANRIVSMIRAYRMHTVYAVCRRFTAQSWMDWRREGE